MKNDFSIYISERLDFGQDSHSEEPTVHEKFFGLHFQAWLRGDGPGTIIGDHIRDVGDLQRSRLKTPRSLGFCDVESTSSEVNSEMWDIRSAVLKFHQRHD